MPSPLAILGQLAGGLSTIGAQGVGGAMEGTLGGIQYRDTQDIQKQEAALRELRMMLGQQELQQRGQPHDEIVQGMYVRRQYPGGPIVGMEPLPAKPLTDLQRAQEEQARATADWRRRQAETAGQGKPHVDTEANFWAAIGKKVADGTATQVERGLWDRHEKPKQPHDQPHYTTDATGKVVAVVPQRGPDGTVVGYQQVPLGALGKPMETPGQAEHRSASTAHLRALTAAAGGKDAAGVRARAELTALRGDLTAQRTALMKDRSMFMDPILAPQSGLTPEQIKARKAEIEADLANIDGALRAIQGERKVPGVTLPGPKPPGTDPLGLR